MATARKTIPIKPLASWSFSRYSDYKRCPLLAKLKHIDHIKEPSNAAMERGSAIHDLAERYIKGTEARLAPELVGFRAEFAKLRKLFKQDPGAMVVEDTWAFTRGWEETTWNDWVGCWVRIKLDCAHHLDGTTLSVTDWKTGRFRPQQNEDYVEQLELYALAALLLHPHLETVLPRLAYTDEVRVYPDGSAVEPALRYTQADVPRLKKLWERRTKPMMADTSFAPRPNDKCVWCFYGQSGRAKGGPGLCQY